MTIKRKLVSLGRAATVSGLAVALAGGAALAATTPASAAAEGCTGKTCHVMFDQPAESFTVPAGVTQVRVELWGAAGAGVSGQYGLGGAMRFDYPVRGGDVITGILGSQGKTQTTATGKPVYPGGGGSLLAVGSKVIAVAGGGGGGGGADSPAGVKGGDGGTFGTDAAGTAGTGTGGTAPQGGTATGAGAGGRGTSTTGGAGGGPATASSLGRGGTVAQVESLYNGGGGGSGYYGGGAGGSAAVAGGAFQGGGGGCGYLDPQATNSRTESKNWGEGRIVMTYILPDTVDAPSIHPAVGAAGLAVAGLAGGAVWLRRRSTRPQQS